MWAIDYDLNNFNLENMNVNSQWAKDKLLKKESETLKAGHYSLHSGKNQEILFNVNAPIKGSVKV